MCKPIALIVLLISTAVWAEPSKTIDETAPSGAKLVVQDNAKGIWFPMDKARALLKDVEVLPIIQSELKLTEQRLSLEENRTKLLTSNIKSMEKISNLWKETAETQATQLAEKAKETWWRNPYLWLAVGFVVGTGTTVGLVYGIKQSGVN